MGWPGRPIGVDSPNSGIFSLGYVIFGVPIGVVVIVLVSLVTPAPSRETQEMVQNVRYPNLRAA